MLIQETEKFLDVLSASDYALLVEALQPEMFKAKRAIAGKQVLSVEKKMHRFDDNKKFDSPQNGASSRMSFNTTSTTSPTTRSVDISAAATPPPPLTADAQSLRSDSIPSTAISAVDEPVNGIMSHSEKPNGMVVPEIGVTDTSA